MNQNKITFQSEKLVVDWISFKSQNLNDLNETQIITYLFTLGFNSYQQSVKLTKPVKKTIQVNKKNKFEVLFIKNSPHWNGTIIQFTGSNASFFYKLVKETLIEWKNFSLFTLNRLDIYYLRQNKLNQKNLVREFFQSCHDKSKPNCKNVNFEQNSRGFILKIGSRRSTNYGRVYEDKERSSLKFELEMKGKLIQDYHTLIVKNQLEEFEQNICSHFFIYFGKVLSLEFFYVDWLTVKLRPIQKNNLVKTQFHTDYISKLSFTNNDNFEYRRDFILFCQLLNYVRSLNYELEYLGLTEYRVIHLHIHDFLNFQVADKKVTYYQINKMKKFFQGLQKNFLIEHFSDHSYQSLVAIPNLIFFKVNKRWVVKIWIAHELFYYSHPFKLPNFFQKKFTKMEFEVWFEIIKNFNTLSIEKQFDTEKFLKNYQSSLSNKQIRTIKVLFIDAIKILESGGFIESRFQIKLGNQWCFLNNSDDLTPAKVSKGFIIYEKLVI